LQNFKTTKIMTTTTTTSTKTFSVICIGHWGNGKAKYCVKKTAEINTKIANVVFQHDDYKVASVKSAEYNHA